MSSQFQRLVLKYQYIILLLIVVFAFFLRFHQIGKRGLAGDEKYSLFVSQFVTYDGNNQKNSVRNPATHYFTPKQFWSKKSLPDFYDSIARVDTGNGSFYTFLLHYWSKIVGISDGKLRFLSLIFNILTIVLLFVFVKKHLQSISLALFVASLASISPFFINYSQIARNYSMQFFFTLLATHLLLLILKNFEAKKSIYLLCIFYGVCVLISELCHISVFPLFFAHGIFVLMYHRKLKLILSLVFAMLIPLTGVLLWLNSDGGKWLIHYVSNSVATYNKMAISQPNEYLSIASFSTIFKQIKHVISCIFLSSEGLYLELNGIKNFIFSVLFGSLSFFVFKSKLRQKVKLISFCYALTYFLVSTSPLAYISLVTNVFFFLFFFDFLRINYSNPKYKIYHFLVILSIIPLFFMVIFAFMDGNTFRIIPRYLGFVYVYNLILIAIIIKEIILSYKIAIIPVLLGFSVQIILIFGLIQKIYADNPPRYFMAFAEPRNENPYAEIAKKIELNYVKGDTVLYCNYQDLSMPRGFDMPQYSVVDAQLCNFYLPKDSEIIQRINQTERNKIFIKKLNGNLIELFDLEETRFRY